MTALPGFIQTKSPSDFPQEIVLATIADSDPESYENFPRPSQLSITDSFPMNSGHEEDLARLQQQTCLEIVAHLPSAGNTEDSAPFQYGTSPEPVAIYYGFHRIAIKFSKTPDERERVRHELQIYLHLERVGLMGIAVPLCSACLKTKTWSMLVFNNVALYQSELGRSGIRVGPRPYRLLNHLVGDPRAYGTAFSSPPRHEVCRPLRPAARSAAALARQVQALVTRFVPKMGVLVRPLAPGDGAGL